MLLEIGVPEREPVARPVPVGAEHAARLRLQHPVVGGALDPDVVVEVLEVPQVP
jgi:hypothetical protein